MIYSSTDIILCFSGVGRSFYYKKGSNSSFVLDMDVPVGENLIAFVEKVIEQKKQERWRYILLPMDENLGKSLDSFGVPYIVAVPSPSDKDEWVRRWWKANATAKQIKDRLNDWQNYFELNPSVRKFIAPTLVLKSDEWIGNVLSQNPNEVAKE